MISSQKKVTLFKIKDAATFKNTYRKECYKNRKTIGFSKFIFKCSLLDHVLISSMAFGVAMALSEILLGDSIYEGYQASFLALCFFIFFHLLMAFIISYDYVIAFDRIFYRDNLLKKDFYIDDQMHQEAFDNKGSIGENNPEYRFKLRTMATINKKN